VSLKVVVVELLLILYRKLEDGGHELSCLLLIESLPHLVVHKLYDLLPLGLLGRPQLL
jgi:hypothetical protein